MLSSYSLRVFFLIALSIGGKNISFAQEDPLVKHFWYNEEKTAKIQIYKATDGKFYGKIAWLKEPVRDGKPRTDINNTDKSRRNAPLMGLMILKEFKKDSDHTYLDGTIYDPKNGKTYSCKITEKGESLDVRGYIGFSIIGRTTVWTKAD